MLDVDSRRFSSAKLASGSKTLAIGFIKATGRASACSVFHWACKRRSESIFAR